MKKALINLGGTVAAAVGATSAMAAGTGPDFTTLTSAIAMDGVSTAVMATGAMVIGVVLAVAGVKVIIRQVKGV